MITKELPVTHERKVAEANVSYEILSANALKQSAAMCAQGNYRHARKTNIRAARLLTQHAARSQSREEEAVVSHWAQQV